MIMRVSIEPRFVVDISGDEQDSVPACVLDTHNAEKFKSDEYGCRQRAIQP